MSEEIIIIGKWNLQELDNLLYKSWTIQEPDKQITFLSEQFLGIYYKENTLIGSTDVQEVFVINLEAVDCFTFIEYIEAMRLSNSFNVFKNNLKKIRYQDNIVNYYKRNHFFTDWREFNFSSIEDVTSQIACDKATVVEKRINLKEDGTYFLPGIESKLREIRYIPSNFVDNAISADLKNGDYIGIYSAKAGLDVSHVGILIKDKDRVILRHASSEYKKVVEQDFEKYIEDKPGIIVLRPLKPLDLPQ